MADSGVIDEDTAQAVESGRETLGALLSTVQSKLRVAFLAFLFGLLGGILAMRGVVWPTLKADLLAEGAEVVVLTPFDVILLQVKIGMIVGVLFAIPVVLYYAREPMAERGLIEHVAVARWKVAAVGVLALALFTGGTLYAYDLFFPIMLSFLAENAQMAGFQPTYSIVAWTQFILVMALSFGLAAQLPLVMSALSYSGVVPYETFRDRWKYAVVVIFVFGAVFSPPDPFTQMMWALPLVALYGFSLYLSKVVVTAKRGSAAVDVRAVLRRYWNRVAGAGVLVGGVVYAFVAAGGGVRINDLLARVPAKYRPGLLPTAQAVFGVDRGVAVLVVAALAAVLVGVLALLYYVYVAIEEAASAVDPYAEAGTPEGIDLRTLDAEGVRAAPPEAFAALSEEEALERAQAAIDADDPEKAQAILDRFDDAQRERAATEDEGEGEVEGTGDADSTSGESESNPFSRTAAGMVDAFTEEETTEDDIGGYYYDFAFVLDSLRSRLFHVFAVFITVLAVSFVWLYTGGIGAIRRDFLARLPSQVAPEQMHIVTLHPVEALIFEVKLSTLLGVVAVVPLLVYYAWPALRERGLVGGTQRVLGAWGGALLGGLVLGSAVGYLFVAPNIISYLVWDALRENMVIAYRVNNFFWLVFLTTIGVGLLADVPISMVLFHFGGIVRYRTMRRAWRGVALVAFVFGALVTPDSIYTMFVVAVPVVAFYWVGLALLWLATLGGRRSAPPAEPAPE